MPGTAATILGLAPANRVSDAILIVNGSELSGLIYAQNRTFEMLHVSSDIHEVYELDMSLFPPVRTGGDRADAVGGASGASGTTATIDRNQISKLESAYVGWKEYDEDTRTDAVTIDVYVAMTPKAVTDYGGTASRLARLAVDTANRAYQQNDLPVSISLAGHRTIGGYTDAGSAMNDLQNLMNTSNSMFARTHAEIARVNADVVVLFVGDYTHPNDDNRDLKNTCGEAHGLLAENTGESFAAVESVCVSDHSFTNVIGSLQGAGSNTEDETNTEFRYGHGYYHAGAERRTVMSQSHNSCDDTSTNQETEVCTRQAIWSDPHRYFHGPATQIPAGTAEDWNARVIFATAPHIASLRGGAQSYDSVNPTGNMSITSPVPTRGTMQVNATFSEPIHYWFPPTITITDGTATTAATMEKLSDTVYTYSHILDGERGNVQLLLSDARDAFGNPVTKTPTSGATFAASAAAVPEQPPAPAGSVHTVHHGFQSATTPDWRHTGNGTWLRLSPTESVPDQDASTNRVVSSALCDDTCILTLRDTLDTTEPLTISFDRYVDAKIDRDEGLFVEYSADNGTTLDRPCLLYRTQRRRHGQVGEVRHRPVHTAELRGVQAPRRVGQGRRARRGGQPQDIPPHRSRAGRVVHGRAGRRAHVNHHNILKEHDARLLDVGLCPEQRHHILHTEPAELGGTNPAGDRHTRRHRSHRDVCWAQSGLGRRLRPEQRHCRHGAARARHVASTT